MDLCSYVVFGFLILLLCYLWFCNRQDRAKAVDILVKDLKVFSSFNEELYKEITQLLTLENFRYELAVLTWLYDEMYGDLALSVPHFEFSGHLCASDCIFGRENEQLSKYGDTKSARSIMLLELKKLIEANPLFRDKLVFPALKASRLRTLINQRYQSYMPCIHLQYVE